MKAAILTICTMCCEVPPSINDLPDYTECYRQMQAADEWMRAVEWEVAISPSRELMLQNNLTQARNHAEFWNTAVAVRAGTSDVSFTEDALLEMQAKLGRERWFCRSFPFVIAPISCCR